MDRARRCTPVSRVPHSGNEAKYKDHILVRANLAPLVQTFLVLYELCHALRDLVSLKALPANAPLDSTIMCLPPDLLDRDSESKAEGLAMIGILPTPEIAWAFRDELRRPFTQLLDRRTLKPEPKNKIRGLLLDATNQTLDKERAIIPALDELLARRLKSVFEYVRHAGSWMRDILNQHYLSPAQADALANALAGPWARINAEHRLIAFSDAYAELLQQPRAALDGRAVTELADQRTRERFAAIREAWRTGPVRPEFYHFGFRVGNRTILTRLITVPIKSNDEVVGSFAVFQRLYQRLSSASVDAAADLVALSSSEYDDLADEALVSSKATDALIDRPAADQQSGEKLSVDTRFTPLHIMAPVALKANDAGEEEDVPTPLNVQSPEDDRREAWKRLGEAGSSGEEIRDALEVLLYEHELDSDLGWFLAPRLATALQDDPELLRLPLHLSTVEALRTRDRDLRETLARSLLPLALELRGDDRPAAEYVVLATLRVLARFQGHAMLLHVEQFIRPDDARLVRQTGLQCIHAVLTPRPAPAGFPPASLIARVKKLTFEYLPRDCLVSPEISALALNASASLGLLETESLPAITAAVLDGRQVWLTRKAAAIFRRAAESWNGVGGGEAYGIAALRTAVNELEGRLRQ